MPAEPVAGPAEAAPGFYGKVPSHGDFVSRRLAGEFIAAWDSWLTDALRCSREQLGDGWLDLYLVAPVWRFVLPAGTCGHAPVAGLVMPSVDRVGRYFPLTVACPLPAGGASLAAVRPFEPWFDEAERLLLGCLDDDFDLETFDAALLQLVPEAAAARPCPQPGRAGWRMPLADGPADPGSAYLPLVESELARLYGQPSLWWTGGSEAVAASVLACAGLPAPAAAAALIDGDWTRWGWSGAR